jgi:hypothetical protein
MSNTDVGRYGVRTIISGFTKKHYLQTKAKQTENEKCKNERNYVGKTNLEVVIQRYTHVLLQVAARLQCNVSVHRQIRATILEAVSIEGRNARHLSNRHAALTILYDGHFERHEETEIVPVLLVPHERAEQHLVG